MIRGLPTESLYCTAVREDTDPDELENVEVEGHGPWSRSDMLLASIADGINYLYWQQNVLNKAKNAAKPTPPTPIRRPGTESANEKYRKTDRYKSIKETIAAEREERKRKIAAQNAATESNG